MPVVRFASTVLLLRENKQNTNSHLHIYTIKRPDTMKFLPGFTVFPGGAIEEDDQSEKWCPFIRQDVGKYTLLAERNSDTGLPYDQQPIQNSALAHIVAGIREVFEETGALICQAGPEYLTPQQLSPYRMALEKKEANFFEIIHTLPIELDTRRLLHIGTRLTPPNRTARFYTNFYITFVPNDIEMAPSTHEVAADGWIDPYLAQGMWEREEILCANPTRECFRSLAKLSVQTDLINYFTETKKSS